LGGMNVSWLDRKDRLLANVIPSPLRGSLEMTLISGEPFLLLSLRGTK